jgi:hypothetical protein
MSCRDCTAEVAHCHEVLLVHADGSYECSGDEACAGHPEAHFWVATCAELVPDGCCSEELLLAA